MNGTWAKALLRGAVGRATAPTEPRRGYADSRFTRTTFIRTLEPHLGAVACGGGCAPTAAPAPVSPGLLREAPAPPLAGGGRAGGEGVSKSLSRGSPPAT